MSSPSIQAWSPEAVPWLAELFSYLSTLGTAYALFVYVRGWARRRALKAAGHAIPPRTTEIVIIVVLYLGMMARGAMK